LSRILIMAVWAVLIVPAAAAAFGGDVTTFVVTAEKLYLKNRTGEWVEVRLDGPVSSNVMSDTPVVLDLKNDGRVPDGEYVSAKLVLSETVRFSGSEGRDLTKKGGTVRLSGSAAKATEVPSMNVLGFESSGSWNKDEEGEVTEHLDLDYQDRDTVMEITGKRDFKKSIVIKQGSSIKVLLGLELKGTVHHLVPNYFSGIPSEEAVYFVPPAAVAELSVKCDANIGLLTSESIEWTF